MAMSTETIVHDTPHAYLDDNPDRMRSCSPYRRRRAALLTKQKCRLSAPLSHAMTRLAMHVLCTSSDCKYASAGSKISCLVVIGYGNQDSGKPSRVAVVYNSRETDACAVYRCDIDIYSN